MRTIPSKHALPTCNPCAESQVRSKHRLTDPRSITKKHAKFIAKLAENNNKNRALILHLSYYPWRSRRGLNSRSVNDSHCLEIGLFEINGGMNYPKLTTKSGIKQRMTKLTLPTVMKDTILQDAKQRDITTARCVALLEILWHERLPNANSAHCQSRTPIGKELFWSFPHGRTHFSEICAW